MNIFASIRITLLSAFVSLLLPLSAGAVLIGHNYDVNGGVSLDCNICHAFHGGSMVPSDAEAYTACTQCHNATSTYPTIAGNQSLWDVANHTVATNTDPSTTITVGCGKCHEVHKSDLLSDAAEFETGGGVARNLAYIRVNMAKYIPGAQTNTVFQQNPNHFAEYEVKGVGIPLNGVCQSCHTDTTYHRNTDTGTDHRLAGDGPPNTINCTGCHKHGTGNETTNAAGESFSATGSHSDTDFGWAGGCESCHGAGSGTEAVVSAIHGNNCDLCHTGGTYDATTNGPGPIANGIDGDASLAEGSAAAGFPATYTCTTCHAIGGGAVNAASLGGIHHDNSSDGVVGTDASCTTKCHNVTGYMGGHNTAGIIDTTNCNTCHTATAGAADGSAPIASGDPKTHDGCISCHAIATTPGAGGILKSVIAPGGSANIAAGDCNTCHGAYFASHTNANHTTRVSLAANCADCHTGTQGTATTVPDNAGNNKVHDACADCHNTTTGALLAAYGVAQANPAGGGSCETCHISGFTGYHGTVSHATMVAAYVNCSTCHTATGNTVNPADPKVHDACTSCHGADGRLIGSAAGNNGGTNGGSDGGGNCSVCHGEYFSSHTNINHTATVAFGATSCGSCHNATAGTATTVPTSSVDDRVHDSCAACHQATGVLHTFPTAGGLTVAMPNGGTAGGIDGGGDCAACHGSYFNNHTHVHDVSYNATADVSQADSSPCGNCHVPATAGTLATWAGILEEHVTGCQRCHSYTDDGDGTPPQADNDNAIATGTGVTCITCHTPKQAPATHGGHEPGHFAWVASCATASCHDQAGNSDITMSPKTHNNECGLCHVAAGGGGTLRSFAFGNTITSSCTDCHNNQTTVATRATAHHGATTNTYARQGQCVTCHDANVGQPGTSRAAGNLTMPENLPCNWCHIYWPNNSYSQDGSNRVIIYGLSFDPNTTEWGTRATTTALPTHTISTNVNPPISDYAACFACHGAATFTGSAGTSTKVTPFHGLGTPYSGDDSVTGGDLNDIINAYSGPQNTGTYQPLHTEAYHPGFKALNWIAAEIGWNAKKPYNNAKKSANFHIYDLNQHLKSTSTYSGVPTFDVPWDNYGTGSPATPVTIQINQGGTTGTQTIQVRVPTLPLTLP